MPARRGKSSGGRTASSPTRRASKKTATKKRGKVRGYSARREMALEAAREAERKLDRRIAREALAVVDEVVIEVAPSYDIRPASGMVPVTPEPAGDLIEVVFTTGITTDDIWDGMLSMDADSVCRRMDWTLGDSRHLVRQGYTPEHAASMTGWPVAMLEDVKIGKWA